MIPCPRPCIKPGPQAGGFDVNEKCEESIHLKPRKEEAADKDLKDVYERAFKASRRETLCPRAT